jgi:hypothetical protein
VRCPFPPLSARSCRGFPADMIFRFFHNRPSPSTLLLHLFPPLLSLLPFLPFLSPFPLLPLSTNPSSPPSPPSPPSTPGPVLPPSTETLLPLPLRPTNRAQHPSSSHLIYTFLSLLPRPASGFQSSPSVVSLYCVRAAPSFFLFGSFWGLLFQSSAFFISVPVRCMVFLLHRSGRVFASFSGRLL